MKYPIPTIITCLSLSVPYSVAIWIFDVQSIIKMGYLGVVGFSVILHSTFVFAWWFVSYFTMRMVETSKTISNTVEFDLKKERDYQSWWLNISVGSAVSFVYSIVALILCYSLDLKFRTYFFMCLGILFLRIVVLIVESKKVKH